jgi:hypothetical protein
LLFQAVQQPLLIAFAATVAAASARIGMAVNPALGFAAFTVFLMLAVDLASRAGGVAPHLFAARFYDVAMGCTLALGGTMLASLGLRRREEKTS